MKKFLIIFAFSCLISAFFVNGAKADQTSYPQNSLIINLKGQFRITAEENLKNKGFFGLSSLDALNKNYGVVKIKPISKDKTSSLYGSFQITFAADKNIPELAAEYKKILLLNTRSQIIPWKSTLSPLMILIMASNGICQK
ncbi:MAG: hypothetical protein ABIH38_00055 [Patescibacteria group bacterium]